ncbi:MAG: electron transfer flavoprotein subunit alpha, partial [Chloroflexi bacterium]|nr:electron transfer flavoprotein subunit alpha [Chloroflexota bacterium]
MGLGLGKKENYHIKKLADVLRGMASASQHIVDNGWATPAQQMGL